MTGQPDLFGLAGRVPAQWPDTSVAAAEALQPDAKTLREDVLRAIRASGEWGMTADEVAARLRLTPFTTRPRCTELRAAGLIVDSGQRRANASGRAAIVWKPAPEGWRP
jgi:predicted ArsR family transcriptional regulator